MDKIDRNILRELQQDTTPSLAELAEKVSLSPTPCWKRIKRLEAEGYITGRVALVNPDKVGLGVSVFVHIKTRHHNSEWLASFGKVVASYPEIAECYRMSGEYDYLLRVVVKDIQSFDRFYKELVNTVEGLTDVTSSFAMEQIKYTTALPL
ncbi:Lrp/AsnC family transcriptional regulator [Endozoicomonas sp. SCSIO W0465]|uniref:Lrp/AsnC family transcriptional regulator n=1 Tax=Endozoicomonas sp. SCSIO W0465 TaxID=2918516 RepID=UPI002076148D|nr:Lrp/AsnC family transcriptional regulator [Endozoicomonas sp. SCSIO W0465]USE35951.1 Lrp/AsnC family transcriptional regulator [Endozoicomonas sp. SCSIO W0465]